jgi:hypothetical protein
VTLTSTRIEADLDPIAFTAFANDQGWGDGLPLIPPTEDLVQRFVDASGRTADGVVGTLETSASGFTVEKIAVNAVMAGAAPDAMPLLCAAMAAMSDPRFDLPGINATTASVVPALFVNGPIRDALSIPYRQSCFGGAAGPGPAIGRALRLIVRNVAGQRAGVTSESVFGQPARVAGIVVGEWEERSPWAPLAERLGVPGDAVTAFPAMGTQPVVDLVADTGANLLETIGKSMAYLGANNFLTQAIVREVAVAVNPTWATKVLGRDFPDIADVQALLHEHASLPIDWFPARLRAGLEEIGRVSPAGRVHLVTEPDDVLVIVCGGLGGLHATMLHSFSGTHSVTRAVQTA